MFSGAKLLNPNSKIFREILFAGLNKLSDRKTNEIMRKILFEFTDGVAGPYLVCRFICVDAFKNISLKSKPLVVEWLFACVAKYGVMVIFYIFFG